MLPFSHIGFVAVCFCKCFFMNFCEVEAWYFSCENVSWDRIPSQLGELFYSQNISLKETFMDCHIFYVVCINCGNFVQ